MNEIEIIERLAKAESQTEQNSKDICCLKRNDENMQRLVTSVEVMATEMKGFGSRIDSIEGNIVSIGKGQDCLAEKMDTKISTLRNEVTSIKDAPMREKANMLDKIKFTILGAFGMGILAYVLSNLFPILFK